MTLYKHYKGNLYWLKERATNSETGEEMVVYQNREGKVYVQPEERFFETLAEHDNVPRFTKKTDGAKVLILRESYTECTDFIESVIDLDTSFRVSKDSYVTTYFGHSITIYFATPKELDNLPTSKFDYIDDKGILDRTGADLSNLYREEKGPYEFWLEMVSKSGKVA